MVWPNAFRRDDSISRGLRTGLADDINCHLRAKTKQNKQQQQQQLHAWKCDILKN